MPAKKPFAVFDIDGTLIRWQLYHAVADALARQGYFDDAAYENVRHARMLWKKRLSEHSFQQYELALIGLVDSTLSGISVIDAVKAYASVLDEHKDQVYVYTRTLIKQLKAKNYILFAISASQSEIVKLLADYYHFDDYGGSVYQTNDGHYTGEKDLLTSERKASYLQSLIQSHNATSTGSIGVGDSESDIAMLTRVETPIAFNPTKDLFTHAKAHGWKIIVERKNVIYELTDQSDGYRLT
jgi:HAD superfamily hydrolase (TIGR01490 family)